jgi:hypothetical protein
MSAFGAAPALHSLLPLYTACCRSCKVMDQPAAAAYIPAAADAPATCMFATLPTGLGQCPMAVYTQPWLPTSNG